MNKSKTYQVSFKVTPLKRLTVCFLIVSFFFPTFLLYAESIGSTPADTQAPDSPELILETPITEIPPDSSSGELSPGTPEESSESELVELGDGGEEMMLSSAAGGDTSDLPVRERSKDEADHSILRPEFVAGSLNYQYKLIVPPGRNGLTPEVSLSYNNQIADDVNWVGYGWTIDIPYIERVNRDGSENLYTSTYFTSSLDGELATTTNASSTAYAAKVDNGDFHNYSFVNNTWTMVDKSGTQYKFGHATTSQMNDTASTTKVYRWMLQEIRDKNDNYVKYTYTKDQGFIYPASIKYTGNGSTDGIFEVLFNLQDRGVGGYATTSRPAFEMYTKYRINTIQTKINGSLTRQYDLVIASGDNGRRQLLNTINETAWDESGAQLTYPTVTFSYQSTASKGWNTAINNAIPMWFVGSGGVDQGVRLADVNGDSYPDMIWSQKQGSASTTQKIYINTTNSTWSYDPSWQFPASTYFVTDARDNGVRLADVNGDLLPDVVVSVQDDTASTTQKTYINSGSGWTENSTWQMPEYFVINGKDNGVRLADINGDGLTDVLYANATTSITYSKVYTNNGSGWTLNNAWAIPNVFVKKNGANTGVDGGVRLADVNNDGLTDILHSLNETLASTSAQTHLNTGTGFKRYTVWDPQFGFVDWTFASGDSGARFADVNGDGAVDIVITGGAYINNGAGWTWDTAWNPGTVSYPNGVDQGIRFADINGDGMVDILQAANLTATNTPNTLRTNKVSRNDLLIKIVDNRGGTTNVSYRQTPQYRTPSSKIANPNLPIILDTVSNVTRLDGVATTESTDYSYAGGLYYFNTSYDRKLAGFASTTETNGLGHKINTFYHQGSTTEPSIGEYNDDISKIAKAFRVEITDNAGNIYHKTINKWENTSLNYGRNFVKLTQSIDWAQDGNSDSKHKASTFAFDDSTGNLSQKITWGEVTASDNGTYSDTGTDKYTTSYEYATSTTADVNLLSHETIKDQSGNKVKETKYYYDTLSIGNADKGNQTKVEKWVTGSTYVNSQKSYNSYGLVTQDTDPRTKITTYTYDTHNLYPATTTNPLSQTTVTQHDYSSGKVATTTDANNLTFVTKFDAFDRVKEIWQPSTSTPSTLERKTLLTYTDNTVPAVVSRVDYLDSSTSTDSYTYLDSFGRAIHERKRAENTNEYIARHFSYNTLGRMATETLPFLSTGGSARSATTTTLAHLEIGYTYDPLNRVIKVIDNVGSTTNTYNDWTLTTANPLSKQKILYKDAYGNLIQVDERNSGSTYTTTYTYDGLGDLTKITDTLSNVRNFTYDGLGRRLTAEDLHAVADASFGTWTYTYDDAGNLTSKLDPKSQTINYTYDDINRPLTEDYTGLAGTEVSYAYDTCSNGKGRLCIATSTGAVASYTYDPMGRVASETKQMNGNTFTTTSYFDRLGNLTNIFYPDGAEARYNFSSGNLIDSVQKRESPSSAWSSIVSNFDYSPLGQISYIRYGNDTESILTYDPYQLYRLTRKITDKVPPGSGGEGFFGFESMKDYLRAASSTVDKQNNAILNSPFEEEGLRTPRSQTYLLGFTPEGDEIRSTNFHTGDVFYKAQNGLYDVADPMLVQAEDTLLMYKAPYKVFLDSSASESPISFHNEDLVLDISFPNTATSSKSATVSVNTSDNGLNNRQVTYQNLLGPGVDVEVTTNTDSLVKEFVLKNQAALSNLSLVDGYYEIPFEITSSHELDVVVDGKRLSEVGPIVSSSTAKIIDSQRNVTYLWAPLIDDSFDKMTHIRNISIRYATTSVGLLLTKLIPAYYFEDAVYPVRTDAVLSPYSSAGDGSVYFENASHLSGYSPSHTWSSIRALTNANINQGTDTEGQVRQYLFPPDGWGISRFYMGFDTSSLGTNATITSAILYTYAKAKGSPMDIVLVRSSQADPANLQLSDFSRITLNNPAEGAIRKPSASWVTTGYTRWDLATTGISWISPTSTTLLALRTANDVDNVSITSGIYGMQPYTNEFGGRGPYLQITYVSGSSTDILQDLRYTYDTAGNITQIIDQSGTNSKKNLYLTYDDLNRVTVASTTGAIAGGDYRHTYTYDALGNLTNKSDRGTYTYSGTGNANPHAATNIGNVAITYDNNGNVLGIGTATSTWDYANRIATITSTASTTRYSYDHLGQRVKYQIGTTATYYPNQYFDVTATTTKDKHIYANNLLIASVRGTGSATSTYWVHTDHLGGSTLTTNASSTLEELNDFYPFGELRLNQQQTGYGESRKYIGQEYDADTSLSYLNARYMDGRSGRFMSEDPVFWEIGQTKDGKAVLQNPQAQNSYSYAQNNPIVSKDPTGRIAGVDDLAGFVGGGLVGALSYYLVNVATGEPSSWSGVAGSFVTGGIIGWGAINTPATLGASNAISASVVSGLLGGFYGNLTKQGIDVATGKKKDVDLREAQQDGVFYALTGGVVQGTVSNARIPNLSSGRNNFNAIGQSMQTKFANETIGAISAGTAVKTAVGSQAADSYRTVISSLIDALRNLSRALNQQNKTR